MKPNKQKVKIGWASVDITPDNPSALQGQFHVRISKRNNDPISATALALESVGGEAQAILISIDAVSIRDSIRDSCRSKLSGRIPDFIPEMLTILSLIHI